MITPREPYMLFATTVGLITSQAEHWPRPNIMACEWTLNCSWEPVRIMVVVHHVDLTHELIRAGGEFGVNLASDAQAHISHYVGNTRGREHDKFANPIFDGLLYRAEHIKPPMLHGCVFNAECVVEQEVEIGEYTGFIGRALTTGGNPALSPLLYHREKYFQVGPKLDKPADRH